MKNLTVVFIESIQAKGFWGLFPKLSIAIWLILFTASYSSSAQDLIKLKRMSLPLTDTCSFTEIKTISFDNDNLLIGLEGRNKTPFGLYNEYIIFPYLVKLDENLNLKWKFEYTSKIYTNLLKNFEKYDDTTSIAISIQRSGYDNYINTMFFGKDGNLFKGNLDYRNFNLPLSEFMIPSWVSTKINGKDDLTSIFLNADKNVACYHFSIDSNSIISSSVIIPKTEIWEVNRTNEFCHYGPLQDGSSGYAFLFNKYPFMGDVSSYIGITDEYAKLLHQVEFQSVDAVYLQDIVVFRQKVLTGSIANFNSIDLLTLKVKQLDLTIESKATNVLKIIATKNNLLIAGKVQAKNYQVYLPFIAVVDENFNEIWHYVFMDQLKSMNFKDIKICSGKNGVIYTAFLNSDTLIVYSIVDNTVSVADDRNSNIGSFKIFPNPVYDFLTLVSSDKDNGTIRIFSPEGIIAMETTYREKINVGGLAPGIYFIRIGQRIEKFVKM